MALDDKQESELKTAHEAALKAANDRAAKLEADLAAAKKPPEEKKPDGKEGDGKEGKGDEGETLREKVAREKQEEENRKTDHKKIESALKFNMGIAEYAKSNEDILPSEVKEILKAADKERYDSESEKASELKANIIDSFFAVQQNLDELTPSQRARVDEYLKLSKNGRKGKSGDIYEDILEPTVDKLKRLRKAEEVGKSRLGFGSSSKTEDAYRDRLIQSSQQTHLGKKGA